MPGGFEITWYGHGTWGHKSPNGTRIIVDVYERTYVGKVN